ncbi:MAG: hypothetical protein NT007_01640 [Candidatus Kapabacteria bacterium]|nr:hypothetical protein [Candidatus Kapabacteria bacterium]
MTEIEVFSQAPMQESTSSTTLGDSCIRRNDRNVAFDTAQI